MSVTTTANAQTYNISAVLADYNLHHSRDDSNDELNTSLNSHPSPTPGSSNPVEWPQDHRRIPPYRPVNRELDQTQRRVYLSNVERTFVGVMFTGVYVEAVSIAISREEPTTDLDN